MKSLITVLFALILTACGGGGGGSGGGMALPMMPVTGVAAPVAVAPVVAPKPICTVALFGDSVMHGVQGTGLLPVVPSANIKAMRPAYTVDDFSYAGATSSEYAPKFLTQQIDAQIVVIEYGINDTSHELQYEVPMRQILDRAKALNKKIIITGIIKSAAFPRYNEYNTMALSLAKEYGATWAGWDEVSFVVGTDTPDGLHPSQTYSTSLVQSLVTNGLDAVSPECK